MQSMNIQEGADKENSKFASVKQLTAVQCSPNQKLQDMEQFALEQEEIDEAVTESFSQQSQRLKSMEEPAYLDEKNNDIKAALLEQDAAQRAIQSASTSHFLVSNRTGTLSKNMQISRTETDSGYYLINQATPHFTEISQVLAWGTSDSFIKAAVGQGHVNLKQVVNLKLQENANVIDVSGADEFFVYVHQQAFVDAPGQKERHEVYARGKLPIPNCGCHVRLKLHEQDRVIQIASGSDFCYILAERGQSEEQAVYVWGKNSYGQLACSSSLVSQPLKLQLLERQQIHSVSCGSYHTALLTQQGELFTCGQNLYGQLGHSEPTKSIDRFASVSLPGPVVQVATGSHHTLVLVRDQETSSESDVTYAFGRNERGQLGLGKSAPQLVATPTALNDLKQHKIVSIEACGQTSAALCSLGKLYVWGDGVWGKFHGANRVRGFQFAASISKEKKSKENNIAISKFGLGRDGMIWVESTSQRVYVWGNNQQNQLPFNDQKDRKKPTEVTNELHGCKKIVVGQKYTLCLTKRNASISNDIPEVKLMLNQSEETVGRIEHLSAENIISIDQKSHNSINRGSAGRNSRSSGSIKPRQSNRRALRKSTSSKSMNTKNSQKRSRSKSSSKKSTRQPNKQLQQMNLTYGLRSLLNSSQEKKRKSAQEEAAIQIHDQFEQRLPNDQLLDVIASIPSDQQAEEMQQLEKEESEIVTANDEKQITSNAVTSIQSGGSYRPSARMNLDNVPASMAPPIHGYTPYVIERRDPQYNHQQFLQENKREFYEQRRENRHYYANESINGDRDRIHSNQFDFSNKTKLFDNREAVISPSMSLHQPSIDQTRHRKIDSNAEKSLYQTEMTPLGDRKLIEQSLDRIQSKFMQHQHSREQLNAQTNQVYLVSNRMQDAISRELNMRSQRYLAVASYKYQHSHQSQNDGIDAIGKSNSQEPIRTRRSHEYHSHSLSRSANNNRQSRLNSCEPASSAARKASRVDYLNHQVPRQNDGALLAQPTPPVLSSVDNRHLAAGNYASQAKAIINESFADTEKQWAKAPTHGFEDVKTSDSAFRRVSQESRDRWVSQLKSDFARNQLGNQRIIQKYEGQPTVASPMAAASPLAATTYQAPDPKSKSVERMQSSYQMKSTGQMKAEIAPTTKVSDPELAAIYKKYESYDLSGASQTAGQRHQSMVGRLVTMKEKAEEALSYEKHSNQQLRERMETMQKNMMEAEEKHRQDLRDKENYHIEKYQQLSMELKKQNQKVQEMETQNRQIRDDNDKYRIQLQSKQDVLEHAKQHRDKAIKECQDWMHEATRFREDVHYLTEQTNLLIDELQTENNTVKALRAQIAERDNRFEQENLDRIKVATEKQKLLEKERLTWEQERRELQSEATRVREENSRLQMEMTKATSELTLVKDRFSREHQLSQQQKEQLAQLSRTAHERDELQSEVQRKQEQLDLQEASLHQLRGTINELIAARASSQFKIDEVTQKNSQLQSEIEAHKAEVSRVLEELQSYKTSLGEVTELNARLQRRVDQEIVERAHQQLAGKPPSIPSIHLKLHDEKLLANKENQHMMLSGGDFSSNRFKAENVTERTTIHVSEPDMIAISGQAGRSTLGDFVTLSNNLDQSSQIPNIESLKRMAIIDSKLEVDRSMQETSQILNQHESLMNQQRERSVSTVNTQQYIPEASTKLASQMMAAQTTLLDSQQNSQINVALDNYDCSPTTYASANKPISLQTKAINIDETTLQSFNIKPIQTGYTTAPLTQAQSFCADQNEVDDATQKKKETNSKLDDLLKKKYSERSKSRHDRIVEAQMAEEAKSKINYQRDFDMNTSDEAEDDKITIKNSDFVQHTRESRLVRDSLADLKNRLVKMRNKKLVAPKIDELEI